MAKTKLSSALLEHAATGKAAPEAASLPEQLTPPVKASRANPGRSPSDVNISAYFPAEVKAALRIVQAKTGKNVKQLLGEALNDIFRKYNVTAAYDDQKQL